MNEKNYCVISPKQKKFLNFLELGYSNEDALIKCNCSFFDLARWIEVNDVFREKYFAYLEQLIPMIFIKAIDLGLYGNHVSMVKYILDRKLPHRDNEMQKITDHIDEKIEQFKRILLEKNESESN